MRRPWIHLVASAIILIILAGWVSFARFNHDDLKSLPRSEPSVSGYHTMDRHFGRTQ